MAIRSIDYNGFSDRLHMIHGDIKEIRQSLVMVNMMSLLVILLILLHLQKGKLMKMNIWPLPVMKYLCTLDDAVCSASQLVKQGGKVAFVHRSGS